jgi:hypothetical protein
VKAEHADDEHESLEPQTAPLFPAWGTRVFRVCLAALVGSMLAVISGLWAWERTPYVSGVGELRPQPVKFDHRHHVRDDGIACTYCHTDVFRSSSAGMPAVSVCMGCHAQIWTQSPELAAVRSAYFKGSPLAWERVTRLPQYVYFNHSIHVAKGVGCVSCHGRVDLMAQVYTVNSFTMDFCLDCHRAPDAALRPLSEISNMEWRPNGGSEQRAATLKAKYHVNPGTDCTTCHR